MKRRILFHLNCLEHGGAERVVTNLSDAFIKQGHEVVIATEWQGKNEYKLNPSVKRLIVGPTKEDEGKSRVSIAILRVTKLRKCIEEEMPDVVIAFARKANYRALMANRFSKVPTIIAIRIDPVGVYDRPLDKISIPLLYPRANGCVFQTVSQKDFFPKYIQDRSTIIMNPINDKYIGIHRADVPDKVMVNSSRIVDFKNQELLVRAFLIFHRTHQEYSLKLFGGDSGDGTWQTLEQIIYENNASSYIHLCGESDELEIEIPKNEIYVLSSNEEGMPNALLEAMAMGMPAIATNCAGGGVKAVMEDGVNGLIVPVRDIDAMSNAMCKLVEDKEFANRLGKEATKIGDKLTCENVANEWLEYIEKVINA